MRLHHSFWIKNNGFPSFVMLCKATAKVTEKNQLKQKSELLSWEKKKVKLKQLKKLRYSKKASW